MVVIFLLVYYLIVFLHTTSTCHRSLSDVPLAYTMFLFLVGREVLSGSTPAKCKLIVAGLGW